MKPKVPKVGIVISKFLSGNSGQECIHHHEFFDLRWKLRGIRVSNHGPAVILLHGYTQTSRMWRPLIPKLADKLTVVAPDLPGINESDIPEDGLDMKTAAIGIHALVKSLGIGKALVIGHDIGLIRHSTPTTPSVIANC